MGQKIKTFVFGQPKNPLDPGVFHNVSLIAFFAWVGLGADGLSSSCYGPEEAFRSLGHYSHLALLLALAVMGTVFLLSASYSQIIELFPSGGGGYLVGAKLLGTSAGLVSGCALLVDYALTIAISIASSMDAAFSFFPPPWLHYRFEATIFCLIVLIILNLRGVKESVMILTPIFITFLITHTVIVVWGIATHGSALPHLVTDTLVETHAGLSAIGWWAMLVIFFRAFALGGGTFTGIEAVSNGLQILREPRVATGKRTMIYMAASLSFMAGGLLINYLLNGVVPIEGKTMNAVLIQNLTVTWPCGKAFFMISMFSAAALLIVAAQAGFLGGPRVMSDMALDRWLPSRFTNLSDRLVIKDGVMMMGMAALFMILYSHASVHILVVMYSINVFLTFTLSQLGMVKHWLMEKEEGWVHGIIINATGLLLTIGILIVTTVIKFTEGGWVTLVVTGTLIIVCVIIRRHYHSIILQLRDLNQVLGDLPLPELKEEPLKKTGEATAVLSVSGYNGIGIHSILAIQRFFPGHFKNIVFISVGIIDSGRFKGIREIEALRQNVNQDLAKYVNLAKRMGFYAESFSTLDTDVIVGLEKLCDEVGKSWTKKVYFMGQLAFEGETFWTRLLHNQTSFLIQKKLLFKGYEAVILPIRLRLE